MQEGGDAVEHFPLWIHPAAYGRVHNHCQVFQAPILAMAKRNEVAALNGTLRSCGKEWWRRGRVELPVQKAP